MKKASFLISILMLFVLASPAFAEEWEKYDKPVPTRIIVRVLSHGAKAMNEHTGAVVVIRDARTGKELDKGPVQGSTGDDVALMRAGYPRIRGAMGLVKGDKGFILGDKKADEEARKKGWMMSDPYFDIRDERKPEDLTPQVYEAKEDAAVFETTVKISKPTQIIAEAYGPLMPKHAMQSAMQSFWLFPGEDITGEGIVLELRGLIVDVQDSLREKEVDYDTVKGGIDVPFYMQMTCGCPISVGGRFGIPWEAEGIKVTTQAYYKGRLYYEKSDTSDKYWENISQFKTSVPLPKDLPEGTFKKERLKIRVMAVQPEQNNTGFDEFNIYLSKAK